jgi:hypothetical protein
MTVRKSSEGPLEVGNVWVLAAPQGFEPRYADPESAVLPLNEGAKLHKSRQDRAEPDDPGTVSFRDATSSS